MKNFTHLHVHTQYSLLDGAARIDDLVQAVKERGQKAVAMTDHGVMYGAVQFFRACKKADITPILGCEVYMVNDLNHKAGREHRDHLVLLAKNETGYRNIAKLDSIGFVEGYYSGKSRIDLEHLKDHTEGVICLTGCLAGRIPQYLLDGQDKKAEEYLLTLKEMFKDDLYVEIQDHGIEEQKFITPKLIKMAKEHNVKLVATNDVHYINKSDSEMHDVLLCIQTGAKLSDEKRMRFSTNEFYLKTREEMLETFPYIEEALDNTEEIVEKCKDFDMSFHMSLLPAYVPDNGMTPSDYLISLTQEGLKRRYGEITKEIEERTKYELDIIIGMGFVEYYLIVWDFINYARKNGIPVGYGRGSGVGSIVAYATGITNVDPLRFKLLFERFLNPERVSMPDFDIDFCCERRGEVIEYVTRKYGSANVCQIVTFGTLAPKNAIRDTARVYEIPLPEVDRITKLIPNVLKLSLKKLFIRDEKGEVLLPVPELLKIYDEEENLRRIIDMALSLEGMPRNTSMHAAGVIICGKEISDYVPLQRNGDSVTTQFSMIECEELGLLKMDFLGLITLTDLKKATDYVRENHDFIVDFERLGDTDKEVYKLIGRGDTEGVFQLESGGMKKFMRDLKPQSMEDIIAGISLYRPGPMDYIPDYIKGKNDPAHIEYGYDIIKEILDVTYGIIVYQEQVMQIVQRVAGYSLGQADIIRRLMSKKKEKEMKIHRELFVNGGIEPSKGVPIKGAVANGFDPKFAEELFAKMEKFAAYAFNKSHAAAYGTVSYQTAYFMTYYPCEFLASILNNRIAKLDEVKKYTSFAKDKGIEVLQPDINQSIEYFRPTKDGKLRFGLAAIKNVGEGVVKAIIEERKNGDFKDLGDFFQRTCDKINKKMVENLIKAGAFDCFKKNRSVLLSIYAKNLEKISADKKNKASGQVSLFDSLIEDTFFNIEYPEIEEFDIKDKLELEREVLGIYVSGHPLDGMKDELDSLPFNTGKLLPLTQEDGEEEDIDTMQAHEELRAVLKEQVQVGGILKELSQVMTKAGKIMKFGKIEDKFGAIDIVFFPRVYEMSKSIIEDGSIVLATGNITIKNGTGYQLNVSRVKSLERGENSHNGAQHKKQTLYLKVESELQFEKVQEILLAYDGKTDVGIKFNGSLVQFPYQVETTEGMMTELKLILGEEFVVLK